jgi:hypothetical protein
LLALSANIAVAQDKLIFSYTAIFLPKPHNKSIKLSAAIENIIAHEYNLSGDKTSFRFEYTRLGESKNTADLALWVLKNLNLIADAGDSLLKDAAEDGDIGKFYKTQSDINEKQKRATNLVADWARACAFGDENRRNKTK